MPRAYSLDLRERIARFVNAGHSCHAAASRYGVSVSFVVKLMAAYRTTGSLRPKPGGGRRHAKLEPHRRFLLARVEAVADITMPELVTELAAQGTQVDPASLSRWFIRNGYRFKKNAAGQRAGSAGRAKSPLRVDRSASAKNAA